MKLRTKVYNRLLQDNEVVAELPASNELHKRWVAIYPELIETDSSKNQLKFVLIDFELEKYFIDNDLDFGEEDKRNKKEFYLNTEEELYKKLEELKINPELFDSPWKCDYPC